ncbi:hypothetical protein TEA_002291 [Camellia sinensis var. sinensis]|uniref:Uncharacterized protein n=2 Tax=Camellia sinensis TaxID=4442 RepID=A0A4S4EUP8_CAMSN|nr:hypothetical protein TEA_002291 [Camellia sinensis var. sinensis]
MRIRVSYILAFLLFSSPFFQVGRSQSDSDVEISDAAEAAIEGGDLGIVGDDVEVFGDGTFSPAPGVETICFFRKNPSRSIAAGEEAELIVGMKNEVVLLSLCIEWYPVDSFYLTCYSWMMTTGESIVNVIAIKASVHLPFDHSLLVQNLTSQVFNNASVPPSAQASFPYIFAVSKFLQPGTFDLVGTIVYEIDQNPYQSTFYNGTIEVTEAGGLVSVESVFLFFLGIALVGFLGIWIRGQIQHLSKKTKRAPKVEVGTKTTDSSMDEWLQCLCDSNTHPTQALRGFLEKLTMRIQSLCRGTLVGFWLVVLFATSFCYGGDKTVLEVVGIGECADCAESNIETSQAFSGLRVTIDCKPTNGEFKTRAAGELNEQGKFKVSLPKEIFEDGKLKEECYAQLHSASSAPCPTHSGLESSKIVFKSKTNDGKHTFTTTGKLKFSPVTCTSAFLWPHFQYPPLPKKPPCPEKPFPKFFLPPFPPKVFPPIYKKPLPPIPIYKKPLPPPVPIYQKPLPPPTPIYQKPLPPPVPIYQKPLPPPVPVYQKPLPPPTPIYQKPLPPPVPIYQKPLPPPTPIYKKPHLPPPIPIYQKPLPPPTPIYKKPLPPPVPIYQKPLPPPTPIYKKPHLPPPIPIYQKPLPPPTPIYKKPLPPPVPIYQKPLPPPTPIYKKPLPPPVPIYQKPLPPPVPIYKKPLPPPVPIYKKPLPPPVPIYKKSLPPPTYENPLPPPVPIYKPPIYKKPLPPPTPIYKPKPPVFKPHPIYKKPLPPIPIYKKPLPPHVPYYPFKPLPPISKPLPPFPMIPKKPCPPFPKIPPMSLHPLPPYSPHP